MVGQAISKAHLNLRARSTTDTAHIHSIVPLVLAAYAQVSLPGIALNIDRRVGVDSTHRAQEIELVVSEAEILAVVQRVAANLAHQSKPLPDEARELLTKRGWDWYL